VRPRFDRFSTLPESDADATFSLEQKLRGDGFVSTRRFGRSCASFRNVCAVDPRHFPLRVICE